MTEKPKHPGEKPDLEKLDRESVAELTEEAENVPEGVRYHKDRSTTATPSIRTGVGSTLRGEATAPSGSLL